MSGKRWTADEETTLRRMLAEKARHTDIAAVLGRSADAISMHAAKLDLSRWKAKRWTNRERNKLTKLLEANVPYPAIAAKLKRTEMAVRERAERLGLAYGEQGDSLLTTARLMGVHHRAVESWIRAGALEATRSPLADRRWVITQDALTAFMTEEAHWHMWNPLAIPPGLFADWAREMRDGVTFLSVEQAATRLQVTTNAVIARIKTGAQSGVKWGHQWYVRADWLIADPVPCWKGARHPRWTGKQNAELQAIYGTVPVDEISVRVGHTVSAVRKQAMTLGLTKRHPKVARGKAA